MHVAGPAFATDSDSRVPLQREILVRTQGNLIDFTIPFFPASQDFS
jgi:hypothetical protein